MESINMAENIVELLTDVADAIREKKGSTEKINAQAFADEIKNLPSGGGSGRWTGHADAEGLRAIGWDDEDIAYYQQYGVNWNEEDDQYHLVSDDNKALYGVLTADNIASYNTRIVYLPKIDLSGKEDLTRIFSDCFSLVGLPMIDTSNAKTFSYMFNNCYSLTSVPPLDTSKATNLTYMFNNCSSLMTVPQMDTTNVVNTNNTFANCYALVGFTQINTSAVSYGANFFLNCRAIVRLKLDMRGITQNNVIYNCFALRYLEIDNLKISMNLSASAGLTKDSLLYIISNEAATSAITLTLHAYAYDRAMADTEIQAALAAHPNVSLAK